MDIKMKSWTLRILAVVLALLCILLLFWPPYGEVRSSIKEVQSYMGYVTALKDLAITQIITQYGIDRSEAEAMFRLIEHMMKPDLSFNNLRVGFNAVNLIKDSKIMSEATGMMGGINFNKGGVVEFTAHVVILNVLFFGTIAAALLAAVLYLLHKSKIGGIVLAIFTCLCTAESIFFVIKSKGVFFPHVSTFLLPIFAIASLILYWKAPNGSLPQTFKEQEEPEPAFSAAPAGPETRVPDAEPVSARKPSFCPNCGEKLEGEMVFCPNCGQKLN